MRTKFIGVVCSAVAVSLLALSVPAMAQQKTEKQCRDEWKAAGGRKSTGKTEKDYVTACHGTAAQPAAAPPAAAPPAAAPAKPAPAPAAAAPAKPAPATAKPTTPKSTSTPKPTGGREAEVARERACGKEWKADKAAGKVAQGMTWPKYWSECDKRKKAAGM
jgi:hypothetical protein